MVRTAALVAVLVLVATVAAGAAADGPAAAQVESPSPEAANESSDAPAPGARLAGVVSVGSAEVDGEIEARAFGVRLERADSNASRAAVLVDQVADLRRRTASLSERKRALVAARENGAITRARFEAEMAAVAAWSAAVSRRANRTEAASWDLPADLLEERGVDVEAIEALRTEARNLPGPEVAAIARSIAGPDAGAGLAGRADAIDEADRDGRRNGSEGSTTEPPGPPARSSPTAPVTVPGRDADRGPERDDRQARNESEPDEPEATTSIPGTEEREGGY